MKPGAALFSRGRTQFAPTAGTRACDEGAALRGTGSPSAAARQLPQGGAWFA